MKLISICVPTYDRAGMLARLLESIDLQSNGDTVELVIVDDGSTDQTSPLVATWLERFGSHIDYTWQENAGRAIALKRAISRASGRFLIPMDSDDYFLPGWLPKVLLGLEAARTAEVVKGRRVHSLIFEIAGFPQRVADGGARPLRTNLLALRADLGVKGDMKEVVEASAAKECLYNVPQGGRRVPTSLLWAKLADIGDSFFMGEALIVKEYHTGGMTNRITQLKVENPAPIMLLNEVIARSGVYRSRLFRMKARLQWVRYRLHARGGAFDAWWKFAYWPVAVCLYLADRFRYEVSTFRNRRRRGGH